MIKRDRLVEKLLNLIRIDSPTGKEGEIADYLENHLKAMSLPVLRDDLGNILVQLDGTGENAFLLNAHMDNVEPCTGVRPVLRDGIITSDGTTVLGADDKAGIAVILEILDVIAEDRLPHPPLEILLTVQEEAGLKGISAFNRNLLRSKYGICLDASGDAGTIVLAAPYHDSLKAVIHGKAAHAGVAPEKGVNAILIAAEAIVRMRLGKVDDETTCNIGKISGGQGANVIPDQVELIGEARSLQEEKLQKQVEEMEQVLLDAANLLGGSVEVETQRLYDGYALKETDFIVSMLIRSAKEIGISPKLVKRRGGSDANVLNASGIQVAPVSVGYANHHSISEQLSIDILEKTTHLVLDCLLKAVEGFRR